MGMIKISIRIFTKICSFSIFESIKNTFSNSLKYEISFLINTLEMEYYKYLPKKRV